MNTFAIRMIELIVGLIILTIFCSLQFGLVSSVVFFLLASGSMILLFRKYISQRKMFILGKFLGRKLVNIWRKNIEVRNIIEFLITFVITSFLVTFSFFVYIYLFHYLSDMPLEKPRIIILLCSLTAFFTVILRAALYMKEEESYAGIPQATSYYVRIAWRWNAFSLPFSFLGFLIRKREVIFDQVVCIFFEFVEVVFAVISGFFLGLFMLMTRFRYLFIPLCTVALGILGIGIGKPLFFACIGMVVAFVLSSSLIYLKKRLKIS